jgi:excisionase family DNA binding protein
LEDALPPETHLIAFLEALTERIADGVLERLNEHISDDAPGQSPWLSVESAAAYLDWPKQRLYRLTASGQIPHYKQEGRLLFHRRELDEWLAHFAQPARTTGFVPRSGPCVSEGRDLRGQERA